MYILGFFLIEFEIETYDIIISQMMRRSTVARPSREFCNLCIMHFENLEGPFQNRPLFESMSRYFTVSRLIDL